MKGTLVDMMNVLVDMLLGVFVKGWGQEARLLRMFHCFGGQRGQRRDCSVLDRLDDVRVVGSGLFSRPPALGNHMNQTVQHSRQQKGHMMENQKKCGVV